MLNFVVSVIMPNVILLTAALFIVMLNVIIQSVFKLFAEFLLLSAVALCQASQY
jgi:hypothetical protein